MKKQERKNTDKITTSQLKVTRTKIKVINWNNYRRSVKKRKTARNRTRKNESSSYKVRIKKVKGISKVETEQPG